jgi:cell division protein FtsB
VVQLLTDGKVSPLRGGVPLTRSPWLSPRRWVILATAVVVAYLIFTAASNTLQAIQIGDDESRLSQDVAGLQERYDQLTALREYLKSDEYIEWVARRELGLVRPGEPGIIVISAATATPPAEGAPPTEQPQRWWEALIGE